MADLCQRINVYVMSKRATQETAHPTQSSDSASILMLDMHNVRENASAKQADVNTDYYLVIP